MSHGRPLCLSDYDRPGRGEPEILCARCHNLHYFTLREKAKSLPVPPAQKQAVLDIIEGAKQQRSFTALREHKQLCVSYDLAFQQSPLGLWLGVKLWNSPNCDSPGNVTAESSFCNRCWQIILTSPDLLEVHRRQKDRQFDMFGVFNHKCIREDPDFERQEVGLWIRERRSQRHCPAPPLKLKGMLCADCVDGPAFCDPQRQHDRQTLFQPFHLTPRDPAFLRVRRIPAQTF
jgi:hypothetical protein